jgi:hypothetical protein
MSPLKTYRVRFDEITTYALDVTADSLNAAFAVAADKFHGLSLAERADAMLMDSFLDGFDIEEGGAS